MSSWWLLLLVAAASWSELDACSCMPMHPQMHYCQSDFVIVGRVQRLFPAKDDSFRDVYKVKIRNTLKATPKAQVALRSGRILTSSESSLCGASMKPGQTYVITGHVRQLEAHVTLCNYVTKWREVTPRQRKGFRMLYKLGCSCKVQTLFGRWQERRRPPMSPNTCRSGFDDCHERHGVCLHNKKGRCVWTRAPRLTRCLQMQRFNGTMT